MGSQGSGINRDVCFTINSVDNHAVCYAIDHVVTGGGNCTAQGKCWYKEVSPTIKSGGVHAVCYGVDLYNQCLTGGGVQDLE